MEIFAIISMLLLPAALHGCSLVSDTADRMCGPTTVNPLPPEIENNCNSLNLGKDKCEKATNDFIKAFSDKDPKTVKRTDYKDYFTDLPVTAGANQNLFWSGTFPIMAELSDNMKSYGVTVSSSANAHASKIINMIQDHTGKTPSWCGKKGGDIDYTSKECDCTPTDTFWAEFSARFAQAASGTAFFLCNGQRTNGDGAYNASSFFGTIEIPNMDPNAVKQVVAIVVHDSSKAETCAKPKTDSLVALKNDLTNKKIGYVCADVIGDPNSSEDKVVEANAKKVADVIKTYQKKTGRSMDRNMRMWDLLRLAYLLQNQA